MRPVSAFILTLKIEYDQDRDGSQMRYDVSIRPLFQSWYSACLAELSPKQSRDNDHAFVAFLSTLSRL